MVSLCMLTPYLCISLLSYLFNRMLNIFLLLFCLKDFLSCFLFHKCSFLLSVFYTKINKVQCQKLMEVFECRERGKENVGLWSVFYFIPPPLERVSF